MPTVTLPTAEFLFNVSSVALVGGALAVLGGTIGTVWMGSVKERYGDARIAATEARTAEANQAAGEANERAGEANKEAARANVRAGQLEKDAAEARLEQEKLQRSNLELQRIIEQERTARLALEKDVGAIKPQVQSLLPVKFTTNQIDTFQRILISGSGNRIRIEVDVAAQTMREVANQLAEAFEKSGWRVMRGQVMGPPALPPSGLLVSIDVGGPSECQKIIMDALSSAGIEFNIFETPSSSQSVSTPPFDAKITLTTPHS